MPLTMTAAQFMATLNATGAHRLPPTKRCERCGTVQRGEFNQWPTCRNTEACKRRAAKGAEPRTFDAYRLPDGSVVRCDASACKGEPVIDFTLADGRIVRAVKVAR